MNKGLGQVLTEQGVLTAEDLRRAEAAQAEQGMSLGKTLVHLGLASERQIVQAVAEQIGLPFADLRPGAVDAMAAGLVPRQTALELMALPVRFGDGNSVVVALADPGNTRALTQVAAATGMETMPALAVRSELVEAIEHLTDSADRARVSTPARGGNVFFGSPDAASKPPQGTYEAGAWAEPGDRRLPAAEFDYDDDDMVAPADIGPLLAYEEEVGFDLDELLLHLLDRGGSDLHLTAGIPPAIRVHGELEHVADQPRMEPDMLRKAIYAILTQKQREKFENELELDVSHTIPGTARFRVNVFQQRDSIGAVMRLIPFDIKPLADLGVPAQIANFAHLPRGLVLVTGPTGSGKSTTLASMIDIINSEHASHIMTVEDPIEFLHQHKRSVVNQRELGSDTHSFAAALKHVLRQDPDVILVGELRDLETIQLAITAAETGHLVFGTLHTQDAPQTVDRVIDVFPPHQQEQIRVMLASALQGVVTQQLLKTADGLGRVVCCEVMVATAAIRNLIREGKTHQMYSSLQAGKQHGMVSMDQSLAALVLAGRVTYNHALERCNNVADFNRLCGKA